MNKKAQTILEELEKTTSRFWNVSKETGEFLYIFAKSIEAKNILEIGTSNGYSGILFASACQKLYTVESHAERFDLAKENFKKAGLPSRIKQIKGHAPEVLTQIKTKFDLAFLDATKYEYSSYLKTVLPKIKKGGFVIADNTESHKSGLKEFFAEVKKLKNVKVYRLPLGTGLLILQKI